MPDQSEEGEAAAIELAKTLKADLLPLEDSPASESAINDELAITGTLRVLRNGAGQDLPDPKEVLSRLRETSFRSGSICAARF